MHVEIKVRRSGDVGFYWAGTKHERGEISKYFEGWKVFKGGRAPVKVTRLAWG
jgi:hypothetical protein